MTVSDPIRTVIWGQPGVGKTTLASKFPNPWFIDIEKSTAWMPELKRRQWARPKTWHEILQQIQRFKAELPGDTLVIDSVDWMEAKYIDKFGAPGGGDDWGKSYNAMDKEFRRILDELTEISELGVHIVMTAHFQVKDQNDPDQMASYSKYILKMQKKTCSAVMEWADEILFLRFRDTVIAADKNGKKGKAVGGQIRDIKTVRAAAYDAKNRFDLPEEIEFKADKALPEPLRTLLWDGFEAYLALKNGQPIPVMQPVQPEPTPKPVYSAPTPSPVPTPQPTAESMPPQPVTRESRLDPRLKALMDRDHVSISDIESLVAKKGWFNCPIEQYPPNFVEQMLIGGWEQMTTALSQRSLVIDDDDLPF